MILRLSPDSMSGILYTDKKNSGDNFMASNKVPLKGYMDGIDISAWQDTIDITKVPCDFVIVKATEGTDYKNRYFAKHCDQAMKAGENSWGHSIMQMVAIPTVRLSIS